MMYTEYIRNGITDPIRQAGRFINARRPTLPVLLAAGLLLALVATALTTAGVAAADEAEPWANPAVAAAELALPPALPDHSVAASDAPRFQQISAGGGHSCGILTGGAVVCWGDDSAGQATPPSGTFQQVSAGDWHTCGVRTDGAVACWGDDEYGQATPLSGTFQQASAGSWHTCGVRTDDAVACWGYDEYGQATPPSGTFQQASAGSWHTCGVRTDGAVACWGRNSNGQATPPSGTFQQVSAGSWHTCGVRTDGAVACWGYDEYGQATPPSGTFRQISAGGGHTCGVRTDGAVACWGDDEYGRATPPSGTFQQVSAGDWHTCGVRTDDAVACWGGDDYGQATPPATVVGDSVAPTNVVATTDGVSTVSVSWTAGGNAVSHSVYLYSLDSDLVPTEATPNGSSHIFSDVPPGDYVVFVVAYDADGNLQYTSSNLVRVESYAIAPVPTPTGHYDADNDGLIEVSNLAQLDAIRYDLDGDGAVDDSADASAYAAAFPASVANMGCPADGCTGYELTADLDFDTNSNGRADAGDAYWNDGTGWFPIANRTHSNGFSAIFDGNGRTISNLYTDRHVLDPDKDDGGLFKSIDEGGTVKRMGLLSVNIIVGTPGQLTNVRYVGGLVGYSRGTIADCYVTGSVTNGGGHTGGLVGSNRGAITGSYADVDVTGNSKSEADTGDYLGFATGGLAGANHGTIIGSRAIGNVISNAVGSRVFPIVGGLAGFNRQGAITASYATGRVTSNQTGNYVNGSVGGLVGSSDEATITASYATGNVNSSGAATTGGLVGGSHRGSSIVDSYAIGHISGLENHIGGLVGWQSSSTVTASYWNTRTSGLTTSDGGVGKTTDELQSPTNDNPGIYSTWDKAVWDFGDQDEYPTLRNVGSGIVAPPTPSGDYDADDDGLIEISNLAQLDAIRYDLDGDGLADVYFHDDYFDDTSVTAYAAAFPKAAANMGCPSSGCTGYELTADLDFDTNGNGQADAGDAYWNGGAGWLPIGADYFGPFSAVFDGGGHTIANLYIDRIDAVAVAIPNLHIDWIYPVAIGLFGRTDVNAVIRHVGLIDAKVSRAAYGLFVGGLVGLNDSGAIVASYATGKVSATGDNASVGGLVGYSSDGTVATSYAAVDVSGTGSNAVVGGLIGMLNQGAITSGYATGSVTGDDASAGGLVGHNRSGTITDTYATGRVTGNSVISTGGLVGMNLGTLTDSYWNTETSRQDSAAGGTSFGAAGKTTDELQSPTNSNPGIYAAWDKAVWDFGDQDEYPTLRNVGAVPPTPSEDYDADDDGLIEISSLAQLDAIRYDPDGDGGVADQDYVAYTQAFPDAAIGMGCPSSGCTGYELTVHLDFDTNGNGWIDAGDAYWNGGSGWLPIGDSISGYDAVFDGNGLTIANPHVNRSSSYVGLFGATGSGAVIRRVGLVSGSVSGASRVGSLAGDNSGTITGSYATGTVSGNRDIGGLVGRNSGAIVTSYSAGSVSGYADVGGLVGENSGNGAITDSYATGNVTRYVGGDDGVGGLVGGNYGSASAITHSYATGRVTGSGNDVGGLVGYNGDGYDDTGEQISYGSGAVTASYWDTETSGQFSSAGGVGKTTDELQNPTYSDPGIYATWDVTVWDFRGPNQYPVLLNLSAAAPKVGRPSAPRLYWVDEEAQKIQRTGQDIYRRVEDQLTAADGLTMPGSIALDPLAGKMYWTDDGAGAIRRANLDGSNVETVKAGLADPVGIALDLNAGYLYWADRHWGAIYRGRLRNVNNLTAETVVDGLTKPYQIALDTFNGHMYWTERGGSKIRRADLDGKNVINIDFQSYQLQNPFGLALDPVAGKMYWTERSNATTGAEGVDFILSADLDSGNVGLVIISDYHSLSGIAVDVNDGKIYWTDETTGTIRRADPAADDPALTVADVVTGLSAPEGVAVARPYLGNTRLALTALYRATDGDNWTDNDGWLSDALPGTWHGVSADKQGLITGLDLSDNNLSGELPAELETLSHLRTLDLSDNRLTGPIPTEWADGLDVLLRLNLSDNQLNGEIPAGIGNHHLDTLNLSGNQVSGSIPTQLGSLVNLKDLNLSHNELSGTIPDRLSSFAGFAGCETIWGIQLTELTLAAFKAYTGTLTNLETLDLSDNKLSGAIPAMLCSLADLETLDLGRNRLQGQIPPELGSLANLQRLYLGNNQLSGSIPPELGGLSNLAVLSLKRNDLSGSIPASLNFFNNLEVLDLSYNDLEGAIPVELRSGAKEPNLKILNLSHNELRGRIPTTLGGLVKLTHLILDSNGLSGNIPGQLGNLGGLSILELSNNRLSGMIPPELAQFPKLTNLELHNNDLDGKIPAKLGHLASLTWLRLSGNDFIGCIPVGLRKPLGSAEVRRLGLPSCDVVDRDTLIALYETMGGDTVLYLPHLRHGHSETPAFTDECIPYLLKGLVNEANRGRPGKLPATFCEKPEEDPDDNLSFHSQQVRKLRFVRSILDADDDGKIDRDAAKIDRIKLVPLGTLIDLAQPWPKPPWPVGASHSVFDGVLDQGWTNNDNWLTDAPLSQWHGVAVDEDTGRVSELHLGSNNLKGEILPELADLDDLVHLNLLDNRLAGCIPRELDGLFERSYGQITSGTHPGPNLLDQAITVMFVWATVYMSELEALNPGLSGWKDFAAQTHGLALPPCAPEPENTPGTEFTEFHEQTPETDRTALEKIYVHYSDQFGDEDRGFFDNRFRGWGSDGPLNEWHGVEVDNDGRVVSLNLSERKLKGGIPRQVGDLGALTYLNISRNHLTGPIPPELGRLKNLETLALNGRKEDANKNRLGGPLPPELGNLGELRKLFLHETDVSGELPLEFGNLLNLSEVNFTATNLEGCLPPPIRNNFIPSLASLTNYILPVGSAAKLLLGRHSDTGVRVFETVEEGLALKSNEEMVEAYTKLAIEQLAEFEVSKEDAEAIGQGIADGLAEARIYLPASALDILDKWPFAWMRARISEILSPIDLLFKPGAVHSEFGNVEKTCGQ